MSREEIYEQLNEVFRDVFDDDTIEVNDQTTSRDIEDWDSLEHINLIAAIETQFGMKFTMGQVVTMKNVGEMVDIISSQIQQFNHPKRSVHQENHGMLIDGGCRCGRPHHDIAM